MPSDKHVGLDRESTAGVSRPRARATPAFWVIVAIAVACAVTVAVARTGTLAVAAFAGLALAVLVLGSALLGGSGRPRRSGPARRPPSGDGDR